jgi:drug/metabolite transporter (DMT)-like permease
MDDERNDSPLYGITLKVMSVAVFMAMSTCIKATAPHIPSGETMFFRSAFAIPLILVWVAWRGRLADSFKTKDPFGHLWRGLVGSTSMFFGFTALGLLPLPEVVTIGYAAPLLATILAAMFLGERLRIYRLTAVFAGLIGVIIVLAPRLTVLDEGNADALAAVGALTALMGAVFAAMAQVFARKLVRVERTATIVIYFSLLATLLSMLTIPFGWEKPTWGEAGLLIAAGLFGGLGQILLTESYRHAETAVLASFEYVSMLMALAVGFLVFDEIPTSAMLGGSVLIVAAGLFIVFRERQLGIERRGARRVVTPQG